MIAYVIAIAYVMIAYAIAIPMQWLPMQYHYNNILQKDRLAILYIGHFIWCQNDILIL